MPHQSGSTMKFQKIPRFILAVICLVILVGNYILRPTLALAFAGSGQLTFVRQVTVNGNNAVSGQTVFSGNKIKVGSKGTAIINLGKLGRLELGANSEMTLLVSENNIGGALTSGCMTINASAGESVVIVTPKGKINSVGNRPSSFFLGIKDNSVNIYPNFGEINITADGKSEIAKPGQLATITNEANGRSNLRVLSKNICGENGALCACDAESTPQTNGNNPPGGKPPVPPKSGAWTPGLAGLLFGTIGFSTGLMIGLSNSDGDGLTCVNGVGRGCRPISPTVP